MLLVAAGCQADIGELDSVFYDGDGRSVHCAVDLDTDAHNSLASIDTALDRAAARGQVVELYAHRPGTTVPVATIEYVLAGAHARGLAFVTYADFAAGAGTGPGIALSFDDTWVDEWVALRPQFQAVGARITFFLTRYARLPPEAHAGVRLLADDGHDIEAHSVTHSRAPQYVEDHGIRGYIDDELVPSIQVLRDEGYPVSAFAYPFGARTDELDRAIVGHVPILRSVAFSFGSPVESPCPR